MTKEIAYGRVGFLGNPSDMYGGKGISFTISNFAEVEVKDSLDLRIDGAIGSDFWLGINGSNDLIKATIKHLSLEDKKIHVSYKTNIPLGSGLAGSSAIIIATIKAFNNHFSLKLDQYEIAEKALHIEVDELGIAAGFQDRYAISFGGVLYMDFSGKEFMRKTDAYGKIKNLEIDSIPFFLSLGMQPKKSSAIHNKLRSEFLEGSEERRAEIKNHMYKIAKISEDGLEALIKKDWKQVGQLMNLNTRLRNQICPLLEKDNEMIEYAVSLGAFGAKVAGSGGCVVVLSEDNSVFEKMCKHYPCFKPDISRY